MVYRQVFAMALALQGSNTPPLRTLWASSANHCQLVQARVKRRRRRLLPCTGRGAGRGAHKLHTRRGAVFGRRQHLPRTAPHQCQHALRRASTAGLTASGQRGATAISWQDRPQLPGRRGKRDRDGTGTARRRSRCPPGCIAGPVKVRNQLRLLHSGIEDPGFSHVHAGSEHRLIGKGWVASDQPSKQFLCRVLASTFGSCQPNLVQHCSQSQRHEFFSYHQSFPLGIEVRRLYNRVCNNSFTNATCSFPETEKLDETDSTPACEGIEKIAYRHHGFRRNNQ